MAQTGYVHEGNESPEQGAAPTEAAQQKNKGPSINIRIEAGCFAGITGLVLCGGVIGAVKDAEVNPQPIQFATEMLNKQSKFKPSVINSTEEPSIK